ncbi:hypothetical protein [Litoreibacter albidus]|uniref:hypothetical protein n=1 Tax=Litoreibacter albidus TaxID=670155 RepID=UPI003735D81F
MATLPSFTLKELRFFLRDDRESFSGPSLARELAKLEEWVETHDDIALGLVHFSSVAAYLERVTFVDHIFQDIENELLPPLNLQTARYNFVYELINCRDWFAFGDPSPVMSDIGRTIVDLIAIGQLENAQELSAIAAKILRQEGYSWQTFYRDRHIKFPEMEDDELVTQKLFPFALQLLSAITGDDFDWKASHVEVDASYVEIAKTVGSDDMDLVGQAIDGLCELHIAWTSPNPDGEVRAMEGFEIDRWAHVLWPSEVLAFLRVRERLGLVSPPLTHPLLQQPLARFSVRPFETSPLSQPMVAFLKKLGSLDPAMADLVDMVQRPNG